MGRVLTESVKIAHLGARAEVCFICLAVLCRVRLWSFRLLALAAVFTTACGGPEGALSVPIAPTPPILGLACGIERWFVKTLADGNARQVNLSEVTRMSIRDLNALPAHCSGLPDRREFAAEYRTFEAVGRVTYVAYQDDRDYHIVLEDPSAPGYTIITELADTACQGAVMSPHLETLLTANASFKMLTGSRSPATLAGSTLRVRGVGFYDFNHGQRGRSMNCLELHPITGIEQIPRS